MGRERNVPQSTTSRDIGGAGVSRVQHGTYKPVSEQLIVRFEVSGMEKRKCYGISRVGSLPVRAKRSWLSGNRSSRIRVPASPSSISLG